MTINLEQLKAQKASIEEEIKKLEDRWPKVGDEFFFLSYYDAIQKNTNFITVCNRPLVDAAEPKRRLFKTSVEAYEHVERLMSKERLLVKLDAYRDGWKPDWEDENDSKYTLYFSSNLGWCWDCCLTTRNSPNSWHFQSREVAEQVISELGDELNLLLED
jgi:hypothetical protein